MDAHRADHFGGLAPTQAYRVDAVCRRFEADWRIDDGTRAEVKRIMWEKVGIVREEQGLKAALISLEQVASRQLNTRSWNFVTLARLVTEAALGRRESRGAHYRSDYPEPDDKNFRHHTLQKREQL